MFEKTLKYYRVSADGILRYFENDAELLEFVQSLPDDCKCEIEAVEKVVIKDINVGSRVDIDRVIEDLGLEMKEQM